MPKYILVPDGSKNRSKSNWIEYATKLSDFLHSKNAGDGRVYDSFKTNPKNINGIRVEYSGRLSQTELSKIAKLFFFQNPEC